jgi:hypothetical protein
LNGSLESPFLNSVSSDVQVLCLEHCAENSGASFATKRRTVRTAAHVKSPQDGVVNNTDTQEVLAAAPLPTPEERRRREIMLARVMLVAIDLVLSGTMPWRFGHWDSTAQDHHEWAKTGPPCERVS